MGTIVAVLDRPETAGAVLAAAALLAQRLPGASIDVLHPRPTADPSFMPSEEVMTRDRAARFESEAAARSAALRRAFDMWHRDTSPAAAWREERGEPAGIVARDGVKADLVVIGRSGTGGGKAIDAALFVAHAAVVLVPEHAPAALGDHIAVAWKPGEVAERAIVAATRLLRQATRVTVLVATEGDQEMPPPTELLAILGERGLVPAMHSFPMGGRSTGAALLHEARGVGADLLVMGAYGRRRAIEMVLGGATRDILAGCDLPVLLHH